MKKYIIGLLVVVAVTLGIYLFNNSSAEVNTNLTNYEASVRFGWIPSASFAGEIVGVKKFADENNISIRCESGGPGLNSIQMVLSGQNTFGTIAADEVLAANDKGADLVIIGVINYYSPGGFVASKESNIKSPKDLEGKKVGLLPFGSTTLLYESMLSKNNVKKDKIEEIIVSPDLRPFITGNYDVHPVFVYDETVTLDMQNFKYNLIEPKDFEVRFKGPVYFCKRKTFNDNPEMVNAFIKTMASGWNYVVKNRDEAISALKEFADEIDEKRELKVLSKAIPYYTLYKNQPLNSDYDSWNEMINELKRLNIIKNDIDIQYVVKLDFIQDFYESK